jgi:hypothetical protein
MKRVLLGLVLAGLAVGIAHAQPDNLTNGVFITHYPPGSVYTNTDQCPWYLNYAISDPALQNPRIDTNARSVWYVLAAWDAAKQWCGVEFGLGTFDPDIVWFAGFGPCPASALAIAYGSWPGPGTGIALAATSETWSGNLVPVYWFDIAAYYPGLIPLTPHPGTGFGGFANCLTPPTSYPAVCFGAMGLYMDGIRCFEPPVPPAACCVCNVCYLVYSEQECTEGLGGIYHPEWTSCDYAPCAVPPTVCCIGHDCYVVDCEAQCADIGGIWHPEWGGYCGPPNPCDIYTPAEPSSWGAIKAIYR